MHHKEMAFLTSKIVSLVFMVVFMCLLVLLQQSSGRQDYSYANVDVPRIQNRRVLINDLEKNKAALIKSGVLVDGPKTSSKSGSAGKEMVVGWELREAPLGPDPLHHHGASPKKPGTKSP